MSGSVVASAVGVPDSECTEPNATKSHIVKYAKHTPHRHRHRASPSAAAAVAPPITCRRRRWTLDTQCELSRLMGCDRSPSRCPRLLGNIRNSFLITLSSQLPPLHFADLRSLYFCRPFTPRCQQSATGRSARLLTLVACRLNRCVIIAFRVLRSHRFADDKTYIRDTPTCCNCVARKNTARPLLRFRYLYWRFAVH